MRGTIGKAASLSSGKSTDESLKIETKQKFLSFLFRQIDIR